MRINNSYELGRFSNSVDAEIYTMSLDFCDEQKGDVFDYGVWYGLMLFEDDPITILYPDNHEETYNAAIIAETDQGFVTVTYFTSPEDAKREFEAIEE